MKSFLPIFVLLSMNANSQLPVLGKPSNDMDTLKHQCIKIMEVLGLKVRAKVFNEDSIAIQVFKGKYLTCSYGQEGIKVFRKNGVFDTGARVYIKPSILMSSILHSVFYIKRDTAKIIFIKAVASVAHELTHYLQYTYQQESDYIEVTTTNENRHISQQIELEAYAVDAYLFLNYINRSALEKIMNEPLDKNKRLVKLINAQWKIQYPRKPLLKLENDKSNH